MENAVGAHLLNHLQGRAVDLGWLRERNLEVDLVMSTGSHLRAMEVKGGRSGAKSGLGAFMERHPIARPLVVGTGGLPLEEFFLTDPVELLE